MAKKKNRIKRRNKMKRRLASQSYENQVNNLIKKSSIPITKEYRQYLDSEGNYKVDRANLKASKKIGNYLKDSFTSSSNNKIGRVWERVKDDLSINNLSSDEIQAIILENGADFSIDDIIRQINNEDEIYEQREFFDYKF